MNNSNDTQWDLGFGEMIEETPLVQPNQPTQFRKVLKGNKVEVFLKRPAPSWVSNQSAA